MKSRIRGWIFFVSGSQRLIFYLYGYSSIAVHKKTTASLFTEKRFFWWTI